MAAAGELYLSFQTADPQALSVEGKNVKASVYENVDGICNIIKILTFPLLQRIELRRLDKTKMLVIS